MFVLTIQYVGNTSTVNHLYNYFHSSKHLMMLFEAGLSFFSSSILQTLV